MVFLIIDKNGLLGTGPIIFDFYHVLDFDRLNFGIPIINNFTAEENCTIQNEKFLQPELFFKISLMLFYDNIHKIQISFRRRNTDREIFLVHRSNRKQ